MAQDFAPLSADADARNIDCSSHRRSSVPQSELHLTHYSVVALTAAVYYHLIMGHVAILVLILTLGVGLASVALCAVLVNRYRLPFLRYYLLFLIWFNAILLFNIFFNYAMENFYPWLRSIIRLLIDISYRLTANILLFFIAVNAVAFLRGLVEETLSRKYKRSLVVVWSVLMVIFFASLATIPQRPVIPFYLLVNGVVDLLVILLVFGEMLRSLWMAKRIGDGKKSQAVSKFCLYLILVWGGVVFLTIALVVGEVSDKQNILLGSFFALLFNVLPLLYLKSFLLNWDEVERPVPEPRDEFLNQYHISKREKEVIELICKGLTNKEIADDLCVSVQTVKDHNYRIYRKLGISNRVQLANLMSGSSQQ